MRRRASDTEHPIAYAERSPHSFARLPAPLDDGETLIHAAKSHLFEHRTHPSPQPHPPRNYPQQYSSSIPKTLNDNFAQHVCPLSHYELHGAAGGRGAPSQHMNMAIKRHLLARLRFAWPRACIFAKLVTKVAKQSSANVVLLQTRRHRPTSGLEPECSASGSPSPQLGLERSDGSPLIRIPARAMLSPERYSQ